MYEKKEMSFAEQLKQEGKGVKTLDPEFMKKERERRLGIDCRVASSLGRPITEKEFLTSNI